MKKKILLFFMLLTLFFSVFGVFAISSELYDNITSSLDIGYSYVITNSKNSFDSGTTVIVVYWHQDASNWPQKKDARLYVVIVTQNVNITIKDEYDGVKGSKILLPGVYYFVGYQDSEGSAYVYIYRADELVYNLNAGSLSWSSNSDYPRYKKLVLQSNSTIYYKQLYSNERETTEHDGAINEYLNLRHIYYDDGEGNYILILINATGNQPLVYNYTTQNENNVKLFSYGGGNELHSLILVKQKWIKISNSLTNNFTAGHIYYIEDGNWYNGSIFFQEENETVSETGGYNVTVKTVDKYNRLIIADYIKVKQGDTVIAEAYNCSQIFINNLNGTYTFEAGKESYTVTQEVDIKYSQVVTLRFSNYEQKYRLKVDVTPNDARYSVKTLGSYGLYTVKTGIGDIDTLLSESGYIIHYSKEGYYDEYYYIYLDNDKDIVINLKAKNQTEIDRYDDYFSNRTETGETWFVVKVQVLDKNSNIITSQTVYVQKAPYGFISNSIGQWNSIAQGVTDNNGIATINFTGKTSEWYRLFTQYQEHEYTQGFTPKPKDIVYVTFRLDQSTLSDSPMRSYFNWVGGIGGTAFGNLLGLMPLLVIVIVMSMLLSFVPTKKRRR